MRKVILKNKAKIFWVILLVSLLAIVRFFEAELFFDPFLSFFKGEFQNAPLPKYDGWQLFLGLSFRYLVNTIVSLIIVYVVFEDLNLVKFAGLLYVFLFCILIGAFFGVLNLSEKPDFMTLFYLRRFLIQPLFLLVFLPAFYYQRKVS
ncbi:exosortase F system-associated protein [Flavobacterium sp. SM15]|uniref:exosortase F system-associated membrane protein n=1 Tax=Flavobacterium sp. SM15 TaxID=2908005 RepID=UPI001EDB8636|nr:exosortase F system-associated protein [Flavobacterium sp. SM15]MCG2610684.1 exosortase F system-associated protein [Flavobacterium sp. SM15]